MHSLKRRLLTAYASVLAIFIILFGAALTWGLNSSFNHMLYTSLESVVIDIKYELLYEPISLGMLDPKEEFAVSPVYIEMWEITDDGKTRLLYSENMTHEHLPILSKEVTTFETLDIGFIREADGEKADKSALLTQPVSVNGKTYLISVATPVDGTDDLMDSFLNRFTLFGILLYLSALYLGYRMIDRVLTPMQSITTTANAISQSNLAQRVPLPAVQDEFFTLAQTFNTMLERIERAFEQVKYFNVNVSHELKTPLTIIQGEAEVVLRKEREGKEYRDVLQSIMEESALMKRIIESMLLLSKSDTAALKKRMLPVVLNDLILEVIAQKKAQADAKAIHIIFEVSQPVTVTAAPELLQRVLSNLLDNAIKYTLAGVQKNIRILLYMQEDKAVIEIDDEGIGISKTMLPHVFEPFFRVDDSHAKSTLGHGLGLAIVKWISDLHDAAVSIESDSNGTKVRILFPV